MIVRLYLPQKKGKEFIGRLQRLCWEKGREESPAAFLERLLQAGAVVLRSNRIVPPLDSRVCRIGPASP